MAREFVYFGGDYGISDPYLDMELGMLPVSFLMDSNALYGDGIFEGIRIYNGRIFKLEEHLGRLWESSSYVEIEIPYTLEELTDILKTLARKNNIRGTGYIRLVVTRGHRLDLGINPRKVSRPTVFIIARTLQLYPKEFYEKGMEVITAKVRRTPASCVNPNVKTCNYTNNILAVIEGNAAGVPEVIMLTTGGEVCECSADNIFIVKNHKVLTPPKDNILIGVTRNTILYICRQLGIEAEEAGFGPGEMHAADEVFLTGSGAEVAPIVKVDNHIISDGKPGEITNRLLAAFRKQVDDPKNSEPIFD